MSHRPALPSMQVDVFCRYNVMMKNAAPALYRKLELFFFAVVLGAVLLTAWLMHMSMSGEDFDSARWSANGPQQRCEMTKDLIKRHVHPGMKKKELLALLGTPDRNRETAFEYFLGSCKGDEDILHFYFDVQDGLIRHQVESLYF